MQLTALSALIDQHFPVHGNWQGLSPDWVCTIWLSSILSQGNHHLVHVEPWVASWLWTLRSLAGQAVERTDLCDTRLERVLRHLSDDTQWACFERALNQHTPRVCERSGERVHVDSTTASAYTIVSDEGLFQFGTARITVPICLKSKSKSCRRFSILWICLWPRMWCWVRNNATRAAMVWLKVELRRDSQ